MDDPPVRVVCEQRAGGGALVAQPAREVVLDDRGAGVARDGEHLLAARRRQDGSGRILVGRLAVEQARSGGLEDVLEQLGSYAVAVGGDGHRAQPRRSCRRERADVGWRLHEYGRARRGDGAKGGRQRGLGAAGHHHVFDTHRGVHRACEPGPQPGQAGQRRALGGVGATRRPGQRCRERPGRQHRRVRITAGERQCFGNVLCQQEGHAVGVHRSIPECRRLPGEVSLLDRARRWGVGAGSDTRRERRATLMPAVPLHEASVKMRTGAPATVPCRDGTAPWIGTIPLRLAREEPLPAERRQPS